MNYTKEEIEEFRKKDIRISRSGIIQALIQAGIYSKEDLVEPLEIFETAKKYLQWVWSEKESVRTEDKKNVEKVTGLPCNKGMVDWAELADTVSCPIPTIKEEEILVKIFTMYRDEQKYDIDAKKLLVEIYKKFGKYPSKENSISTVMEKVPLENLF